MKPENRAKMPGVAFILSAVAFVCFPHNLLHQTLW